MSFYVNYGGVGVSDGKVKINEADPLDFLGSKIDNSTLEVVSNLIVAKKLDGMTSTVEEINMLSGLRSNIQTQIDTLSGIVNFAGVSDNYADLLLSYTEARAKDMVIVIQDENHNGDTTVYIFNGTIWTYSGNFDINMRDFTVHPIDLTSEVTGILPNSKIEELGKIGSKLVDETGISNGKIPSYNSTTGKFEMIDNVSSQVDWEEF